MPHAEVVAQLVGANLSVSRDRVIFVPADSTARRKSILDIKTLLRERSQRRNELPTRSSYGVGGPRPKTL